MDCQEIPDLCLEPDCCLAKRSTIRSCANSPGCEPCGEDEDDDDGEDDDDDDDDDDGEEDDHL